jgi:hypothetical protein
MGWSVDKCGWVRGVVNVVVSDSGLDNMMLIYGCVHFFDLFGCCSMLLNLFLALDG